MEVNAIGSILQTRRPTVKLPADETMAWFGRQLPTYATAMALVVLLPPYAARGAVPASSAASSAPTNPRDLSTPIASAKALFNAIAAGDRDGVFDCLYAADESQRDLAAAMADLIINGKALGDAARARFGKAGDPIGRGMLDPADISRFDQAKVETTGDAAVVTVPGQTRPMSFRRREDGRWRLVITDFAGAAPENIARQTGLVRMMAEAMRNSADELMAGKYATPDAALIAIQQKLHAAMISFNRPATTRATTQPTTSH